MTDTTHHATPSRDDIVDRLVSAGSSATDAHQDADLLLANAAELDPDHRPGYLARMLAGEELRGFVAASGRVTIATGDADSAVLVSTGPGRWHGPECGDDTIGWVRAARINRTVADRAGDGLLGELVALLNGFDDIVITHRWALTLDGTPVTPDDLASDDVRSAVRAAIETLLDAPDPTDAPLRGIVLDPAGGPLG
ncbi:hypothetical protein DVS28_b0178 (plasmid) [Euzebya pacifica]|uniref:Uncharacterized protein n=1 Tax=Euzebya pacifica TaxID=1608957 RepID=A0A346Y651_9ACTN|nr:hypothetical protein [Euzebya pacifica]AXV09948.1 hypothetical protein DVS28_b0178 [Euzebya pacifica]